MIEQRRIDGRNENEELGSRGKEGGLEISRNKQDPRRGKEASKEQIKEVDVITAGEGPSNLVLSDDREQEQQEEKVEQGELGNEDRRE